MNSKEPEEGLEEEKKPIEEIVKVFNERLTHDENNRIQLRVVKWNFPNKPDARPTIEARRQYHKRTIGKWINRQIASIGADEFKIVLENAEEISKMLGVVDE